jgi:hypothetical protein
MAYAGDLKSPDAEASCGFDPHPGYHRFILKLNQLILPSFRVPVCTLHFLNDRRIASSCAGEIRSSAARATSSTVHDISLGNQY